MKILHAATGSLLILAGSLSLPARDFNPTSFGIMHYAAPANNALTGTAEIYLSTDKAVYAPGESVSFTATAMPAGARIRYRHGYDLVEETDAASEQWQWTPPTTDYRGYMVDIYVPGEGGAERILGSIAVDVSSDWVRFPRYGFIADFGADKLPDGVIEAEMDFLNRCHINGVQFQDWHNKHHWPLGGTRDNLLDVYTDIANRDVYTSVVKRYIDVQHAYGMKSIFYNLAFGVLSDAESDGVESWWNLYRNPEHTERDYHGLPADWKSDIYLVNPGNWFWQEYMIQRNDDVYHNFDFDGFQIDQLGDRGWVYDFEGKHVYLPTEYASFINRMKEAHPGKRLIMNSVSSYGSEQIVKTGKVDFAYNETWDGEHLFSHLHDIIATNDNNSEKGVRTCFASYVNYEKQSGTMNTPGVLLTDAVMMALGGDHLELGDHMLCREYFPYKALPMTDRLREAMICYYDFMTAYQNLLRDCCTWDEFDGHATTTGASPAFTTNNWPPELGKVTVLSRRANDTTDVHHLLNFVNAGNLSWRDLDGSRPEPQTFTSVDMSLPIYARTVSRVWIASPDFFGGVARSLPFTVADGNLYFTVPTLRYWDMVVVDYADDSE